MTKQAKDAAFFVVFCIEEYKEAKGISGDESFAIFEKYGVTDYLYDYYEPLHTQSSKWLIEEIDNFIEKRK